MQAAHELADLLERERRARSAPTRPAARTSVGSVSSRRLTRCRWSATVTSRCWAPSCRLRSTRRRSASPAATIRARESVRSRIARRRSVTSRTTATTSSGPAGAALTSNSRSSPRWVRRVYSTVASLPCSSDVRTHCIRLLGDVGGQQLVRGRADDLVGRVRELRRVAADLEVGAVGPQAQEQVGQSVEQRLVACLDRCGNPLHAAIVDGVVAGVRSRGRRWGAAAAPHLSVRRS